MSSFKQIIKAARFAKLAHAGQKRKHGTPYFNHPKAVSRALWGSGVRDPDLIAAAYTHDVLEDCQDFAPMLKEVLSSKALVLVNAVTRNKGESYQEYCLRIKATSSDAVALKLADVAQNIQDLKHLPKDDELHQKLAKKLAIILTVFKHL